MDQAAVARHRLEAMEAWIRSLRRAATPRRRPGPGGSNRRQPTWPLAAQQQSGAHPGPAQRLLRFARPRSRGAQARRLIFAEPPYTDPYVRWCGRGGAARLPPIPIGDYPMRVSTEKRMGRAGNGDSDAFQKVGRQLKWRDGEYRLTFQWFRAGDHWR